MTSSHWSRDGVICPTVFVCRCRQAVVICSRCDRGQHYCGLRCSEPSRQEKQRKAQARYRRTFNGRSKQAERQRRFRERRAKVTHQGSTELKAGDLLQARSEPRLVRKLPRPRYHDACHVCRQPVSPHVRWGFLDRQRRRASPTWPPRLTDPG